MSISDRIRVKDVRLLSDNHYILKSTTFDWRRDNGEWQTQHRETYDRGNGATLLPYNREQRSVVLVRQLRYPAYVNGYYDLMIEAPAGLLDDAEPEARIRAEVEEETGWRVGEVTPLLAFHPVGGMLRSQYRLFRAHGAEYIGEPTEENEAEKVAWVPLDEVLGLIDAGQIATSSSLVGLLRVLAERK